MKNDIKEILSTFPITIEAPHTMQAVNEAINLYSGTMSLQQRNITSDFISGRIFLAWLPIPETLFEIENFDRLVRLEDAEIKTSGTELSYPVSVLSSTIPNGPCRGCVNDWEEPHDILVDEIRFHLPNFHSYIGAPVRDAEGAFWRGRLSLRHDPWSVVLDKIYHADRLKKTLEAEGGFLFTNTGSISHASQQKFSLLKGIELLDALYYFFSFARGDWCGPTLPIAFKDGDKVWSQVTPPRLRSWRYRRSWFPTNEYKQVDPICHAFSGFLSRWNTPTWQRPLRNAIHWYVEANSNAGGVEGGIILTQTALELLSWLYLVEDLETKQFEAKAFDKKKAKERIALFLQALSITIEIPQDLNELCSSARHLNIPDGPAILASLRNSIVHPHKENRDTIENVGIKTRIEALSLALWYLEMSLLRLFRYDGLYYSRLKSGVNTVIRQRVPWEENQE